MSLSALWKLYAINTAGGLIDGIQNVNRDSGDEEVVIASDGLVDPTFVAMIQQRPVVNFETVKIAHALAICGIGGYAIAADADMYWQKMKQGGTRESTGHIKVTAGTGLLIPQPINASQGGEATIGYRLLPISDDGVNAPLTVATGQSLAGSPAVDEAFTVGPAKYGASMIQGVTQSTIDLGLREVVEGSDGETYATFAGIDGREPSITVQTKDIAVAESTIGRAGQKIDGTSPFKVWLRKKAQGGGNVAAGTAEHVLFTVNAGRIVLASDEAQHDSTGTATLRITPVHDGTNDIVAVSTGAAIA